VKTVGPFRQVLTSESENAARRLSNDSYCTPAKERRRRTHSKSSVIRWSRCESAGIANSQYFRHGTLGAVYRARESERLTQYFAIRLRDGSPANAGSKLPPPSVYGEELVAFRRRTWLTTYYL